MELNERISKLVRIINAEKLSIGFHEFFKKEDVDVEVYDGEPMIVIHDLYFNTIEAQDVLASLMLIFPDMDSHRGADYCEYDDGDENGVFWKQGLILDQIISEGENNERRTESGNGARAH